MQLERCAAALAELLGCQGRPQGIRDGVVGPVERVLVTGLLCAPPADSGADISANDPLGRTRLHVAVSHDKAEMVRALLDAGADIDVPNDRRDTPLQHAVICGKTAASTVLLQAGADVNARKPHG